jgi:hypothetical protein
MFTRDNPSTWGNHFHPLMIAHDVGSSHDRSTAVVGGNCPSEQTLVGISELIELPQGQRGHARAQALAEVDRRYGCNALIHFDVTYDPSYADILFPMFGPRLIGVHITHGSNGTTCERRPVKNGAMLVYTVGRSYLLDNLHNMMEGDQVRLVEGPASLRAYAQLEALETEINERGIFYKCPPGQHDDLAMSMAMLVWGAQHPHLRSWFNDVLASRRPSRPHRDAASAWRAFT